MDARRFLTLVASAFLVLKGLLSARAEETAEDALRQMKQVVRSRFPDVGQLSQAELATWLAETNRPAPLLPDVRTPAEFPGSQFPRARRTDPPSTAAELSPSLPADRPVVVYCSVGYRSSELATRLIKAGRTNVVNLEGSLFQWANEGRALRSADGPAKAVHPYNEKFGRMLRPSLRPARWETPK